MDSGQSAIAAVRESVLGLLEDLRDGVKVTLVRDPEASLWSFLSGKAERLPFSIEVDFQDDTEDEA